MSLKSVFDNLPTTLKEALPKEGKADENEKKGGSRFFLPRKANLLGLAVPQRDNSTNTRLHIQFFHSGLVFTVAGDMYKTILEKVWKHFGGVISSDIHYHKEFSYCFVPFRTHAEAEAALAGLNDAPRMQRIIDSLIATLDRQPTTTMNETAKSLAKGAVNSLFVKNRGSENVIRASWASPRPARETFRFDRRDRHYGRDYDDDVFGFSRGDDCPDGIDQEEWDNYCDGRSS